MRTTSEQILVGVAILAIVLLLAIAVGSEHFELVPATVLGGITALLSYAAYHFSREKVRLDLFDKRWEIYEETLKFCSAVTQEGTLKIGKDNEAQIAGAIKSAHSSFRGIGFHRASALFGDDVQQLFDELNRSYSWLVTYSDRTISGESDWPEKHSKQLKFIWDTVQRLPEVCKPYMYFGDIRNDHYRKNADPHQ